eukprot:gene29563-33382_t
MGSGALRGARAGSAGLSGGSGMGAVGSGMSGQKGSNLGGAARRDNFDTASLRSQDDTARYDPTSAQRAKRARGGVEKKLK